MTTKPISQVRARSKFIDPRNSDLQLQIVDITNHHEEGFTELWVIAEHEPIPWRIDLPMDTEVDADESDPEPEEEPTN